MTCRVQRTSRSHSKMIPNSKKQYRSSMTADFVTYQGEFTIFQYFLSELLINKLQHEKFLTTVAKMAKITERQPTSNIFF